MAGNSLGNALRLTTFGESHGAAVGGVLDGVPAGIAIDIQRVQHQLDRRRPGQSVVSTSRNESDQLEILSGLYDGISTGAPIGFLFRNADVRSADYDDLKNVFRPSHADYTYHAKYGIRDHRGGGRSSARATVALVTAGAIAEQMLEALARKENRALPEAVAYVTGVGSIELKSPRQIWKRSDVDENIVRCPEIETAKAMQVAIDEARRNGDSLGGTVSCYVQNVPVGLGEPVFDKLQADLAKAVFTINAVHGFEYGMGFAGSRRKGSEVNDAFVNRDDRVQTETNHSGGIQGGISNGMAIYFRVAFKPTATISREQQTVDTSGNPVVFTAEGRHDPCVVPRAVPIVEAAAAFVVADHWLRHRLSRV